MRLAEKKCRQGYPITDVNKPVKTLNGYELHILYYTVKSLLRTLANNDGPIFIDIIMKSCFVLAEGCAHASFRDLSHDVGKYTTKSHVKRRSLFCVYCLVRASCPSQASFLALLTDRRSLVEDPAFQDNMRAFHARCGEIYIMLLVAQIYLSKTATFCRYIERPADAICPSFCAYFLPIFVGLNPIL